MADDTGSGDAGYGGAAQEAPAQRTFFRAADGKLHAMPLPLRARLAKLRRRSLTLYIQAAVACDLILGLLLLLVLWILTYSGGQAADAVGWVALAGAAALVGVPAQLHRLMQSTWVRFNHQLYENQLALMVADDQFWQQIFERERDSPWLKWAQSIPPRSVEEHLLFAASYHEALAWLVGHPGSLRSERCGAATSPGMPAGRGATSAACSPAPCRY
jgi:hypothetical protein